MRSFHLINACFHSWTGWWRRITRYFGYHFRDWIFVPFCITFTTPQGVYSVFYYCERTYVWQKYRFSGSIPLLISSISHLNFISSVLISFETPCSFRCFLIWTCFSLQSCPSWRHLRTQSIYFKIHSPGLLTYCKTH